MSSFTDKLALIAPGPGTYALVFNSPSNNTVQVGKLGRCVVLPGYYVYIGSAFGPGGLRARLKRHCAPCKKLHWHIDYLKTVVRLEEIWYTQDQLHLEHKWAEAYTQCTEVVVPYAGFGASDCHCLTHLFFSEKAPQVSEFAARLSTKSVVAVLRER